MQRSFFCPSDILLYSVRLLGSRDWRKKVLRDIDCLYIPDDDLHRYLPDIPFSSDESIDSILSKFYRNRPLPSRQEFIDADEDLSTMFEFRTTNDIETILEDYGDRIMHAPSLTGRELSNGAFCKSLCERVSAAEHSVFEFDEDDPQVKPLQRGWYDEPDPVQECDDENSNQYSWKEFFINEPPVSNSVVIIDRYIFQSKKSAPEEYLASGAKQIAEILNGIIPKQFHDTYYVTVVFEYNQLIGNSRWENPTPIAECLKNISKLIVESTIYQNVQLNYIAIKDPNKEQWFVKNDIWRSLHGISHDRRIITNYYWIIATAALNVSEVDEGNKEVASRFQHIELYSLFRGVDNPDQKTSVIPFYKIKKYLGLLVDYLKSSPSKAYICYAYNKQLKQIKKGSEQLIQNNLLEF